MKNGGSLSHDAQRGLKALMAEASELPTAELPAARVPLVSIAPGSADRPLHIGRDDVLFDGQPFPFTTLGPWLLEFPDDGATTLTVSIAIGFERWRE